MMTRPLLGAALALSVLFVPDAGAGTAGALTAEDAARKIGLADRQRMLSQRIAGAACLRSIGVSPDAMAEVIVETRDTFGQVLHGLMNGSEDLNLPFEQDEGARAALEALDAAWTGLDDLAESAGRVAPTGAQLRLIADAEPAVSDAAEEAMSLIRQGSGAVPLHKAIALDVAGRQRMLSQKMQKEACLVSAGIDADENRASLAENVGLFDMSLGALVNGFDAFGLQPASTPDQKARLAELQDVWSGAKAAFEPVAAGATLDVSGMEALLIEAEALLAASEETAAVYEAEAATQRTH